MKIIRIIISFLCILTFYFMSIYAKEYSDSKKDAFLFRLSMPDGLKGRKVKFLYKRVVETKEGYFAFYFKNKLVWVKSQDPHLIKVGDLVSLYGHFGENKIFYPEGSKLERSRALKKGVSAFGCLIAFLLYFKGYRFNFKLFLWEPRELREDA